jgi:glutamate N-acetyltransferase/amino-acid N-acetyltransferase
MSDGTDWLGGANPADWQLPKGFRFAAVRAGVKPSATKLDLSLVVSDRPASAAGMFTTNKVCAAPVQSCRARLPSERIRGIVINSGNANACTGDQGRADAEAMAARLAGHLKVEPSDVLVASTGVIGRPMPMGNVLAGIDAAFPRLSAESAGLADAAIGILTTDTKVKVRSRTVRLAGGEVTVLGFCKGAAMIGPNMATMLAFLLTDAEVDAARLRPNLIRAVDESFHSVSVEGHTSTNDTVLLLASGASGVRITAADEPAFSAALTATAQELARAIVEDAEGVTHVMAIEVGGTRTDAEARLVAKTVAESALVKTAVFGHDPNWGRICSAAGYAGIDFREEDLSLTVNGTLLYDRGRPTAFDAAAESARMKASREIRIQLAFTLGSAGQPGPGSCRFWSTDLSFDYVRLNADYTT